MSDNQSSRRTRKSSVSEKLDEVAHLASDLAYSDLIAPPNMELREVQTFAHFPTNSNPSNFSSAPFLSSTKFPLPATLGIKDGFLQAQFYGSGLSEGLVSTRRSEATESDPLLPLYSYRGPSETALISDSLRPDYTVRLVVASAVTVVVLFCIGIWVTGQGGFAWSVVVGFAWSVVVGFFSLSLSFGWLE